MTNVCASGDSACPAGSHEGQIPARALAPWSVDWLNSFRQNVAERGLYDAPDAIVSLRVECATPSRVVATLRNVGAGRLPAATAAASVYALVSMRIRCEGTKTGGSASTPRRPRSARR